MEAEVKTDGSVELRIVRDFAYPPEKVFEAWLRPEQLARWMGPTEDTRISDVRVDAVEGGSYQLQFNDPDGSVHIVKGVYQEIIRYTRLAFTWAWEPPEEGAGEQTLVTLEFEPITSGTRLTLLHRGFSSTLLRDRHTWGWNGTLDKLERHAAHLFADLPNSDTHDVLTTKENIHD